MQITLNGAAHDLAAPSTVHDLLEALEISRKGVAVERNLEIVPKSAYDATVLCDGDRIEIVQFVGGG